MIHVNKQKTVNRKACKHNLVPALLVDLNENWKDALTQQFQLKIAASAFRSLTAAKELQISFEIWTFTNEIQKSHGGFLSLRLSNANYRSNPP